MGHTSETVTVVRVDDTSRSSPKYVCTCVSVCVCMHMMYVNYEMSMCMCMRMYICVAKSILGLLTTKGQSGS